MPETYKQGAVDVVQASDRIDAGYADELRPLVDAAVSNRQPMLVVDLKDVPLIDSDGLEFLMDVRDLCLRRGGEFKLSGPGPLCQDILRVSGVDEDIEVVSSVVAAAGSFAR